MDGSDESGEYHISTETNHVSDRPSSEAVTPVGSRSFGTQEVTAMRTAPMEVGAAAFATERLVVDVRHSNRAIEMKARERGPTKSRLDCPRAFS